MSRFAALAVPLVLTCGCTVPKSIGGPPDAASDQQSDNRQPGSTERCGNGIDDNGDGRIDEGCPCAVGATHRCYGGAAATRGIGACHDGVQTCVVPGGAATGNWGDCSGDHGPTPELCGDNGNGDRIDQDCDGADDNGCGCCVGTVCQEPRECPTGPNCAGGKKGTQTCGSDGKWSACEGAVPCPMPELSLDAAPPPLDAPPDAPPDMPPACMDLAPPRLMFPLSTATVTSWKPNLRWELGAGTDGAHIELCSDRACSPGHVLQTYDVIGSTGAPPDNLPTGVSFWHARGKYGNDVGCSWSLTWEFYVGWRSAPVNTAWGSFPDPNGDGFADALVGVGGPLSEVRVYPGGSPGVGAAPLSVVSVAHTPLTYQPAFMNAGDVDGDGFSDVIVQSSEYAPDYSVTYYTLSVHRGMPVGVDTRPIATIPIPHEWGLQSLQVLNQPSGDVNGDGYADVAFAYVTGSSSETHVAVFWGGPNGLAPGRLFDSGPLDSFKPGYGVAGLEDLNGDTLADIVLVDRVLLGAGGGPVSAASRFPAPHGEFAVTVDDVNADGYGDALLDVSDAVGKLRVFFGGPAGLDVANFAEVNPPGSDVFDGVGDITGNGHADLAGGGGHWGVPSPTPDGWRVYEGGPSGLALDPSFALPVLPIMGDRETGRVARTGDLDGDGIWDVLIDPGLNASPRVIYACRGGAGGFSLCVALEGVAISGGGAS